MPGADPRTAPALWSPEAAPNVVILASANTGITVSLLPDFDRLAEANLGNDCHTVVAKGDARLRLCIRIAPSTDTDCLIIPDDKHLAARLRAAARYENAVHGRCFGPDQTASPSPYRRARFVLLLAIHDGLEAGASARDLAFGLAFARHQPLSGAAWKGSDERRHTHRLIAETRKMVDGGYRTLLRHG